MKQKYYIPLAICAFFAAACASHQEKDIFIEEAFVTNIKSNGIKIFVYNVMTGQVDKAVNDGKTLPGGSRRKKGKEAFVRNGVDSPRPGYVATHNPNHHQLLKSLDIKLAETGYCRRGYLELDNFFDRSRSQIRGECKDGATQEDREKFPNRGG
ncbi:MAG: hypothetical protein OEW08_06795 [Gammaproteobacteria bacterium]|nr:hypothetical protein [Gammaproteobacteria bacterium]